MSNPTVAEYIVRRLSVLGIDKAFGVPSDYAFPIADAIEASPDIDWVGCTNELNAAYAVDGYARLKGAGLLCAAYGVGELSLVNGLMASRAHRVPVFFLTGQPSRRITKQRLVSKHTLGDGVYGNFEPIIEAACCAKAVISPDSAIAEMERVIREALSQSQPAYIVVLHDAQDVPVIGTPVTGEPLSRVKRQVSVDAELEGALTAIVNQLKNAHNPVILPTALTARYGLRHKIGQFIEAANIPRKLNCAPYATSARRMPAASHDRTAGAPTGHNREDHLLRPDSAKVTARSPQGHARTKQAELTDAPSERLVSRSPGMFPAGGPATSGQPPQLPIVGGVDASRLQQSVRQHLFPSVNDPVRLDEEFPGHEAQARTSQAVKVRENLKYQLHRNPVHGQCEHTIALTSSSRLARQHGHRPRDTAVPVSSRRRTSGLVSRGTFEAVQ